jgi:hypothetical protein
MRYLAWRRSRDIVPSCPLVIPVSIPHLLSPITRHTENGGILPKLRQRLSSPREGAFVVVEQASMCFSVVVLPNIC